MVHEWPKTEVNGMNYAPITSNEGNMTLMVGDTDFKIIKTSIKRPTQNFLMVNYCHVYDLTLPIYTNIFFQYTNNTSYVYTKCFLRINLPFQWIQSCRYSLPIILHGSKWATITIGPIIYSLRETDLFFTVFNGQPQTSAQETTNPGFGQNIFKKRIKENGKKALLCMPRISNIKMVLRPENPLPHSVVSGHNQAIGLSQFNAEPA